MKETIPVALLVRVSTVKQETDRQIHELEAAALASGWDVVEVIEETGISRRDSIDKRHGLARALHLAKTGAIRKVLVHEVSRIGRPAIVHPFVETLHQHKVSLYWHSQRVETLLPDGRRSQAAGVMLALFSELAHAEVETLSERTRSGLAEARRRGKTLGRPVGTTIAPADLLAKHADVVRLLKAGQSIRHAAAISGKSKGTVENVKRVMG